MKKTIIFLNLISVLIFISCIRNPSEPDSTTLIDFDGNIYQTIIIGDQIWMAENLKVTHYRNGDSIFNIQNDYDWDVIFSGAYCSYNNDDSNIDDYGLLYNWYAVNDARGLAPSGWHIPTKKDWETLINYLFPDSAVYKTLEQGSKDWISLTPNAINENEFNSRPGGFRDYNGSFRAKDYKCYWWASNELRYYFAYSILFSQSNPFYFFLSASNKQNGLSVRCIKGEQETNFPVDTTIQLTVTPNQVHIGDTISIKGFDFSSSYYSIFFPDSLSVPYDQIGKSNELCLRVPFSFTSGKIRVVSDRYDFKEETNEITILDSYCPGVCVREWDINYALEEEDSYFLIESGYVKWTMKSSGDTTILEQEGWGINTDVHRSLYFLESEKSGFPSFLKGYSKTYSGSSYIADLDNVLIKIQEWDKSGIRSGVFFCLDKYYFTPISFAFWINSGE